MNNFFEFFIFQPRPTRYIKHAVAAPESYNPFHNLLCGSFSNNIRVIFMKRLLAKTQL